MTKILIVEDNDALLESIALALEMRGYDILKAPNGKAALNLLEMVMPPPSIIVSDIAMPVMNGYEFLQAVQENDKWQAIPFIYLTAFGSEEEIRKGKELGVDDYLVKPFKPEDLVVAMENKLRRIAEFEANAERKLDDVRRQLLNLISHELNTPLTAIYGGTEILAEDIAALPDELSHQTLNVMKAGVIRMKRLIDQVLLLVQIDSGHLAREMRIIARPCSINQAVENACTQVDYERTQRNITINTKLSKEAPSVHGIQDTLTYSIAEVLRNAINFSQPGSTVEIETLTTSQHALIKVKDKGIGLPEEALSAIWEPFTQWKRSRFEQQGAGLGLTITRNCIQLHKGQCYIESQLDQGTTVTIELPLT